MANLLSRSAASTGILPLIIPVRIMSSSLVGEVYIALIGYTGVGKTSLVNALQGKLYTRTDSKLSLHPDTTSVAPTSIEFPEYGGVRFTFLDTPGLNEDRPDEEKVLVQLEGWLSENASNAKIAGILCVANISSPRVTEAKSVPDTAVNYKHYVKLCGANPVQASLVTTFWDDMDGKPHVEQRQEDLAGNFRKMNPERIAIRYKRNPGKLSESARNSLNPFLYTVLEQQARQEVQDLRVVFRKSKVHMQLLDDWESNIASQRALKDTDLKDDAESKRRNIVAQICAARATYPQVASQPHLLPAYSRVTRFGRNILSSIRGKK
ncbi:hypothetical protein HGRIS_011031 [Hohenbuehelia grisea]|uniref:G domain-containing protein n=1 Tax=Hohenbuehelia grisea TaxID=104357 RepID=A0ABR3IYW0_9AGAR